MKRQLKTREPSHRTAAIALIFLLSAPCLHAGIVLNDPETWDSGTAGWENAPPPGTGIATVGNPGGYLQMTFPAVGGPPPDQEDVMYADSGIAGQPFTGDYTIAGSLGFQFYAEDLLSPLTLVYLHSAVGGGSTWEYAFTTAAAGVWEQEYIPLTYTADWIGRGGAAEFLADLANIDWVGIYVARNANQMQQDFGLDDWTYYEPSAAIPEPGVISVIATSLLSFTFLLRQRLRKEETLSFVEPGSPHDA